MHICYVMKFKTAVTAIIFVRKAGGKATAK